MKIKKDLLNVDSKSSPIIISMLDTNENKITLTENRPYSIIGLKHIILLVITVLYILANI